MKIKGFDRSFLIGGEESARVEAKEFLDKVMVPSNYFDYIAAVAAVINEKDPVTAMCNMIRTCTENEHFIKQLEDAPDKESEIYKNLLQELKDNVIDNTISFATLAAKLFDYKFIDEQVFRLFVWMISTGSIDYMKDFIRYCEDTGKYIPAIAIVINMFQECRVIVPMLYDINTNNYIESIQEIFPDFYNYIFQLDGCELDSDDFIDFLDAQIEQKVDGAEEIYDELVDFIYDFFDNEDCTNRCFLDRLANDLLPTIEHEWNDLHRINLARKFISLYISLNTVGDDDEN